MRDGLMFTTRAGSSVATWRTARGIELRRRGEHTRHKWPGPALVPHPGQARRASDHPHHRNLPSVPHPARARTAPGRRLPGRRDRCNCTTAVPEPAAMTGPRQGELIGCAGETSISRPNGFASSRPTSAESSAIPSSRGRDARCPRRAGHRRARRPARSLGLLNRRRPGSRPSRVRSAARSLQARAPVQSRPRPSRRARESPSTNCATPSVRAWPPPRYRCARSSTGWATLTRRPPKSTRTTCPATRRRTPSIGPSRQLDLTVAEEATAFPIATASTGLEAAIEFLLQRFGKRWRYLLAVNGAYIDGASVALTGAGLSGDQAPFSVSAGDGDESEFARIRGNDYQAASVAEPLNLQGWQLIDELNRARARQPPSGYVAPPRLITQSDVPSGAVFDPLSGYRQNYLRIWHR